MANQEQLIFGALVIGVALLFLNTGKEVSPEAIAAGEDQDDDDDDSKCTRHRLHGAPFSKKVQISLLRSF